MFKNAYIKMVSSIIALVLLMAGITILVAYALNVPIHIGGGSLLYPLR